MTNEQQLSDLLTQAQHCMRKGDSEGALEALKAAEELFPDHHDLHMNKAMVYRLTSKPAEAITALNSALAKDPYSFLALLAKGSILEGLGQIRSASEIYKNVLKISPDSDSLPTNLAQQLAHASQVVREQSLAQASYLREILGSLPDSESRERHRRFEEAIDVASGTATVHYAHPIQLHYPRLPAIPFFERHHFPWIEELERSTPKIKDELEALQLSSNTDWAPYVRYQPGTPENQFKELNNNSDWSSIWLWRDGAQQRAADLCPETMDVLKNVPLADQPGFAPTALFSALAPLKRIPPHTGSTNTRALVHLPLVVPGPAFFRVGNETRQWHTGAAWVFDDTIQHEAWNDAGETRIILIFDVWNPFLSEGEKDKIRTLLTAKKNWLAEEASH